MIRCRWHNYAFRLADGKGINCPGYKLRVFDVKLENGALYARAVDGPRLRCEGRPALMVVSPQTTGDTSAIGRLLREHRVPVIARGAGLFHTGSTKLSMLTVSRLARSHPATLRGNLTEPEEIETWLTAPTEAALKLRRPLKDGRLSRPERKRTGRPDS